MPQIIGTDRNQIQFLSLETQICADNNVRFIDAFVDKLDCKKLGVASLTLSLKKKDGRPSFSDALLLKLYLFAYINGIRSSRKLERETAINIELQWLLYGLRPNYYTIADFRKVNATALKNLFKLFVSFLKDADLIGCEISRRSFKKINNQHRISVADLPAGHYIPF